MFILLYGFFAIIVLVIYAAFWTAVITFYVLVGLAIAIAVVTMGVLGLVCSLVLGLTRWAHYRSSYQLRRGLSDGWLFGIGQCRNMSKSR